MAPPPIKKPRHEKLGYFINAAKKRKANKSSTSTISTDEPTSSTTTINQQQEQESAMDDTIDSPMSIDINNNNNDMADANRFERSAVGAEGMASSSAAGGMRGTAPLPTGVRQTPMRTTRKYNKTYLLRVQNESIEGRKTHTRLSCTNNEHARGWIRYPYHDLPVHKLAFYLSKMEIHELVISATTAVVKEVSVKVYNKTGVLNFETASSKTAIGNNNVGIYLVQLSKDLNEKRTGELPNQYDLLNDIFWGDSIVGPGIEWTTEWSNQNISQLGAQYVRRTLNNKFQYSSNLIKTIQIGSCSDDNRSKSRTQHMQLLPVFDIQPFIEKRVNVSMNEGLFCTYSYKPKKGLISGKFWAQYGGDDAGKRFFNYKSKMPMVKNSYTCGEHTETDQLTTVERGYNNMAGTYDAEYSDNPGHLFWRHNFLQPLEVDYIYIELDNFMDSGPYSKQPPLVIGIEPLTTEIGGQGSNKWEPVQCHVDLYVQVECEIEITQGVDYVPPNRITAFVSDYKNPIMSVTDKNHLRLMSTLDSLAVNNQDFEVRGIQTTNANGYIIRNGQVYGDEILENGQSINLKVTNKNNPISQAAKQLERTSSKGVVEGKHKHKNKKNVQIHKWYEDHYNDMVQMVTRSKATVGTSSSTISSKLNNIKKN